MPIDREAGIALAIQVCRKLVEAFDEASVCDLCGCWEDEGHDDSCAYIDAKRALQLLGIKE